MTVRGFGGGIPKRCRGKMKRKLNKAFLTLLALLVVLCMAAVGGLGVCDWMYGQLNYKPLSARVTYNNKITVIDDGDSDSEVEYVDGTKTPIISRSDDTVSIDSNGLDNVYAIYSFTGDKKYIYRSNAQWNEYIALARQYGDINPNSGYVKTYDSEFTLTENGWYTVIAIWYDEGKKHFTTANYEVGGDGQNFDQITINREVKANWQKNKDSVARVKGITNILFIGLDSWSEETEGDASDLMVMMSINNNNQTLSLTTFSKEAYVYIPGVGCGRLANTYTYGSGELTVKTIEENFGICVDRYIMTNFENFIRAVDCVGGLDLNIDSAQVPYINQSIDNIISNPESTVNTAEHLKTETGVMHLDGVQTLAYIRYYQGGDFRRSDRYNQVITAYAKSLVNTPITSAAFDLVKNVFPEFTTDLELNEFFRLVYNMSNYRAYDFENYSIPTSENSAFFKEQGVYNVLLTDDAGIEQVVNAITDATHRDKDLGVNFVKIIIMIYLAIVACNILAILYIMFIRKRRVVYVDFATGTEHYGSKKYRWNAEVHLYRQNVIPGRVREISFDKNGTYEAPHQIKMPMRKLVVYVKTSPSGSDHSKTENRPEKEHSTTVS